MSYEEQVKRATTPREALLLLARGLDALQGRDPWADWDEPRGDTYVVDAPPPNPIERLAVDFDGIAASVIGPDGLTDAQRASHAASVAAMSNTDAREFALPPPSREKMEQRRMLERQQLHLADALGTDEDWTEAYAKGGPWWLWQTQRDTVMGFNHAVRQMMVADVEADDPKLAYEMALDVLKHLDAGEPDFETGAGGLAPQGWKENANLLRGT